MVLLKADEQVAYCGVPFSFYDVDGAPREYTSDRSRVVGEVGQPAADAYQSWAACRAAPYDLDGRLLAALPPKARKLLRLVTHRPPLRGERIVVFTES